jgi:hypothetical protein
MVLAARGREYQRLLGDEERLLAEQQRKMLVLEQRRRDRAKMRLADAMIKGKASK